MQVNGLCRGVSGRLFLRRWKYASDQTDECIDCGVCEPECPIDAIKPDTEEGASDWVEHNTKYGSLWPNITKKRAEDVPQDQEKWRGVPDKFKHFSEKPGKGD